jgi:hypothetical protein
VFLLSFSGSGFFFLSSKVEFRRGNVSSGSLAGFGPRNESGHGQKGKKGKQIVYAVRPKTKNQKKEKEKGNKK